MPRSAWCLHKTEAGQAAFKQRSGDFSARQRAAFLLFDGKRTVADVLLTTASLGVSAADLDDLIAKGLLEPPEQNASSETNSDSTSEPPPSQAASNPKVERYQAAYVIATRLTSQLGLRGFKLNLAVEAASGYDDLVALLPKLTDALGPTAVREVKKALGVP